MFINTVNRKIIDAVIEKAERECPESLALIGIYGSVATGDAYEKSDLDLLILIQDNAGQKLGAGFILDDSNIGYDIYCTTWNGLRWASELHDAQISKLMDSKIVYVKNQEDYNKLCELREQTSLLLTSEKRLENVKELIDQAKISYANAYLHENLGQVRLDSFGVINCVMNAAMIFYGEYFKRGVKRMLEELMVLGIEKVFIDNIKSIVKSKDVSEIRELLKNIILYAEKYFKQAKELAAPSDNISETWEEMYSNWRNKVEEAAEQNDGFSSFMNMCSLQTMFDEISSEIAIGEYNIMEKYDVECLENNIKLFDDCLKKYADLYKIAGLSIKRYSNVDEFVSDYLKE